MQYDTSPCHVILPRQIPGSPSRAGQPVAAPAEPRSAWNLRAHEELALNRSAMSGFKRAAGPTTIFSYGSNSTAQLRARVKNQSLQSRRASLEGFARVFCMTSRGWGNGGVASLAPQDGSIVHGSVVVLTPDEKLLLDVYEDGYREEPVCVHVHGESTPADAIAYIAGEVMPSHGEPFTLSLDVPPSPEYLTAIHAHLREHWPMDEAIAIRSCRPDGSVETLSHWRHPGVKELPLAAVCVETSVRLAAPWRMPQSIRAVCTALASVGIENTAQLSAALRTSSDEVPNDRRLEDAGAAEPQIDAHALDVMRSMLRE